MTKKPATIDPIKTGKSFSGEVLTPEQMFLFRLLRHSEEGMGYRHCDKCGMLLDYTEHKRCDHCCGLFGTNDIELPTPEELFKMRKEKGWADEE
jgi:hypothetical protein